MEHAVEQQLISLLIAHNVPGRAAAERASAAERLFAELIGGQLGIPSPRSGELLRDVRPDIWVTRPDNTPLVVEVKLALAASFPKNLRNRAAGMLATAVEVRRSFKDEVTLAAVVLLGGPDGGTALPNDDEAFDRMAGRLLRAGDGVGYDAVLIGTPRDDMEWRYFASDGRTDMDKLVRPLPTDDALTRLRAQTSTSSPKRSAAVAGQKRRVMLVIDEWRSGRGGLSTMNRELATALASTGVDVAVMVPHASDHEINAASDVGVALVVPARISGLNNRELLLLRPIFADPDWEPDVIMGHGRVLGAYAAAQKEQFFPQARRVHFVHTDAEQLEAAKERPGGTSRMASADERRNLERDLARSADLVVGVGPLLAETIRDDLIGPGTQSRVICLVPGLRTVASAIPPVRNTVLIIGRADDFHSKGIDIAAEALLKVVDRWPSALPHPPVLVLRGVPDDAATEVKAGLDEIVEGRVGYLLRPYSDSEETVMQDLAQAQLLLMPSRHEGFGLAAYEAIASEVPVLISEESGLAQFLRESSIDTEPSSIVTTRNTSTRPAIDAWADAIWQVLRDRRRARAEAGILRTRLTEIVDWQKAVAKLLAELDDLN